MWPICLQGRVLSAEDVQFIRRLRQEHADWNRWQLSLHVAETWNWRNGAGQLKDMAARTLLLKLHRRGLIELPPPQRSNGNSTARNPSELELTLDPPLEGPLSELTPVSIQRVETSSQRGQVRRLLAGYHYLGFRGPVGENIQYLIEDRTGRMVAVMVFGAAAWKCAPRDQFIGWTPAQRQARLSLIANHQRFLILPWVKVPHLSSYVLARIARRLVSDWQERYGHRIVLLETFIEQGRFLGMAYRAANWHCVGMSTGRSRQDRHRQLSMPIKAVWVYPLSPKFRQILTAPMAGGEVEACS